MTKRVALGVIFGSLVLIALAYAAAFLPGGAPGWAAWAMMLGTVALMTATMVLGAARDGRIGWLGVPFALVFLVLVGAFGAALALPEGDAAAPRLYLGLPPRAAAVLYGVGLLPLLVVPLAYALSFDGATLREGDVARVREARARREAE